jgi:PhnB protein
MPVANMFWGDRCGQLTDPFGHKWTLATHKEDLTPDEMGKRAGDFFAQMALHAG